MKRLILLSLVLALAACATGQQDSNLGEGDKHVVANMFDSVSATTGDPKYADREAGRGGEFAGYMTYVAADGTVMPVLGPDGQPLQIRATGFRNLIINNGEIRQTATASGTSEGTQNQDNKPTNEPEVSPDLGGVIP